MIAGRVARRATAECEGRCAVGAECGIVNTLQCCSTTNCFCFAMIASTTSLSVYLFPLTRHPVGVLLINTQTREWKRAREREHKRVKEREGASICAFDLANCRNRFGMLGGTFNCCCRFLFWIANLLASFWQVVPASVFCSSMLPPQTECRTGERNRVEPLRYYRSDGVYDKKSQQMFSNGKLSAV